VHPLITATALSQVHVGLKEPSLQTCLPSLEHPDTPPWWEQQPLCARTGLRPTNKLKYQNKNILLHNYSTSCNTYHKAS
jgi:hypothetical protein